MSSADKREGRAKGGAVGRSNGTARRGTWDIALFAAVDALASAFYPHRFGHDFAGISCGQLEVTLRPNFPLILPR
jgi:hypothetical protein